MKDKIWLSSPHMGGNELTYIHDAFENNWVAPLGPNVDAFERDIEQYLNGGVYVATLSAGTAALHLALVQLGVQAGDEVICQSMTFSASANPIAYQGAIPVFIDSEPETWNMDPMQLEMALQDRVAKGKKPKAIIVVHLYGMPAKMDLISAIAESYGVPIIEDAAEALGSTYRGRACGTFGQFGVLSFNGNKIITTSGGGALVCPTLADKEKTLFLATQARDQAAHYQHSHIGYNYRMSNICAGIGRGQMEVLADRVRARRAMHDFYVDLFRDIEGVEVFSEPDEAYYSNHWLSAILIDPSIAGATREALRLAFQEDNIESRPLWKPMHLQPIFADSPYFGEQVAEKLFNEGLCLPSGSNLSDEDRIRISVVVRRRFS